MAASDHTEGATMPTSPRFTKSRKNLSVASEATALHRDYARRMWADIARGEQFVFGYGPMELFSSMGLYLVQHSAYGSLLASKQLDRHYKGVLEARGYFRDIGNYHSLALGYAFDKNPDIAPDGGIPRPAAVVGQLAIDIGPLELYAREFGCPLYLMEDPDKQASIPGRWWEMQDWIDPHIVEFCVRELEGCCRFLEAVTGKHYSPTRLRRYLERADAMAELYWRAADIAFASEGPAPITITDCLSEVAVFETHFGEEWALEHVRKFFAEVKDRADRGLAACPDERVRLLWASTPLWFNLGFYNRWEESHGAIFMEMNYLPRSQRMIYDDRSDPLRAVLMRRHMKYSGASPRAAADLCVHQARKFRADGVIVPKRGATRHAAGMYHYVALALERAGIPTLAIEYEPTSSDGWDDAAATARVTAFIESLSSGKRP
jgi:hypothetical protein